MTSFINNTANNGGAVKINCYYLSPCINSITNSNFISNMAILKGGGINYNSYQPEMINNVFENNSASFRPNMANYAVKLMMMTENGTLVNLTKIDGLPSGLKIESSFKIAIVNNEEQIMTNDNKNAVKILPIDSRTDVKGQSTVVATDGIATFSSTIFVGAPGKNNVRYTIKSYAINYNALKYVDPEYSKEQILTVSFRYCRPGEYQNQNAWIAWGAGSYSVIWNETQWHNWPSNAACEGSSISLNSGYWRANGNSTDIMEWPNPDAWLGGYITNSTYPVYWASGYEGLLCNECIDNDKEKYERISDNQWSKCPDPTLNFLRIIGFGILILIFLVIMIL